MRHKFNICKQSVCTSCKELVSYRYIWANPDEQCRQLRSRSKNLDLIPQPNLPTQSEKVENADFTFHLKKQNSTCFSVKPESTTHRNFTN